MITETLKCRQELLRRNIFEFDDDSKVNYRTMLQRLIKDLHREQEEVHRRKREELETTQQDILLQKKKEMLPLKTLDENFLSTDYKLKSLLHLKTVAL